MYARALYAERDAEVDAGPAGVWLAAVTAGRVPGDGHDLLQGTVPLQALLPWLAARVQTARRCGRLPVQLLGQIKGEDNDTNLQHLSMTADQLLQGDGQIHYPIIAHATGMLSPMPLFISIFKNHVIVTNHVSRSPLRHLPSP